MDKRQLGAWGEETAKRYLEGKGYRLRDKNAYFGHNEIDLIMLDGDTVVFVEVKARSSLAFGHGRESVGVQKQRRMAAAARAYLAKEAPEKSARFDVVEVDIRTGEATHIEHAFLVDAW